MNRLGFLQLSLFFGKGNRRFMEKEQLLKSFKRGKYWRLAASVVMDLLGMATFLVPGIAEVADLVWAPLAGIVHVLMFRSWPGAIGGAVTFFEEFLPATDWVPSFTLDWILHYFIREQNTFRKFLKRHNALQRALDEHHGELRP